VQSPRVGDDLAVATVDHGRDIHFAVTSLDSQVMSVSHFILGSLALKSRWIRLSGAGVLSPW
jgi:hypothetical protein